MEQEEKKMSKFSCSRSLLLHTEYEFNLFLMHRNSQDKTLDYYTLCHDLEKFQGTKFFISINQIH